MAEKRPFIPYPPIEQHGVIGDRRTAALVAADGTITWLCLPDYDSMSCFGALLDAQRGGFWRFSPAAPVAGAQRHLDDSAALVTTWEVVDGTLEPTDAMAWPGDDRPADVAAERTVLRRLRCTRGTVDGALAFHPAPTSARRCPWPPCRAGSRWRPGSARSTSGPTCRSNFMTTVRGRRFAWARGRSAGRSCRTRDRRCLDERMCPDGA